jgi:HAD superfamily phosphoserine phosphatase-like hydrolase
MSRFTTVIFDVDGTLTPQTSWEALTEALGCPVKHLRSIYLNHKNGEIDSVTAERQVLELWCRTGPPTRDELLDIFSSFPMRPEAGELIGWLKDRGYKLCIISGSMDLYVYSIALRLGVTEYFFNTELVFNEREKLVDLNYHLNQSNKKVEQLKQYLGQHKIALHEVAVVGNGANDIGLFEYTRHGILLEDAYAEPLRASSWRVVQNLLEVKTIPCLDNMVISSATA